MGTLKREPNSFPHRGVGGPRHRYSELSKADWADAYADLYRQVFGGEATAEDILTDAEHRDDLRRNYDGQSPVKRPRPKQSK